MQLNYMTVRQTSIPRYHNNLIIGKNPKFDQPAWTETFT